MPVGTMGFLLGARLASPRHLLRFSRTNSGVGAVNPPWTSWVSERLVNSFDGNTAEFCDAGQFAQRKGKRTFQMRYGRKTHKDLLGISGEIAAMVRPGLRAQGDAIIATLKPCASCAIEA